MTCSIRSFYFLGTFCWSSLFPACLVLASMLLSLSLEVFSSRALYARLHFRQWLQTRRCVSCLFSLCSWASFPVLSRNTFPFQIQSASINVVLFKSPVPRNARVRPQHSRIMLWTFVIHPLLVRNMSRTWVNSCSGTCWEMTESHLLCCIVHGPERIELLLFWSRKGTNTTALRGDLDTLPVYKQACRDNNGKNDWGNEHFMSKEMNMWTVNGMFFCKCFNFCTTRDFRLYSISDCIQTRTRVTQTHSIDCTQTHTSHPLRTHTSYTSDTLHTRHTRRTHVKRTLHTLYIYLHKRESSKAFHGQSTWYLHCESESNRLYFFDPREIWFLIVSSHRHTQTHQLQTLPHTHQHHTPVEYWYFTRV